MKLLTQNDKEPNCLVYAAAMILNADVEDILSSIGHRGQEMVWPGRDWPTCLAGVHIQEIQDVAYKYGKCFYPIEFEPTSRCSEGAPAHFSYKNRNLKLRMMNYLIDKRAILVGKTHAVAWDGEQVYDPNGMIYEIELFMLERKLIEAWVLGVII
jgi:hypothetical protein